MTNQPNKATVKDAAKREQTGYFLKQQPILDGDIVAQHCEMVDDHSGKVSTQLNRLLVCWNGSSWDVKCLDAMVGYRNQYWGCIPAFHEVVGNAVDNPEMIPSEVEWTRKDSEPVKEGLPTAKEILDKHALKLFPETYTGEISTCIIDAMQEFSDQQSAELRERVKELEKEVNDMTEFIPIYEGKIHKERCRADDAENRVKELEAKLSQITEIDQEDDKAWGAMKEIRSDDYDLGTEREEEIFQFAFFEGIRYIQKALKK